MPLFIIENRNWSSDAEENAQYQRITRAWNRIHQALLDQPDAIATTIVADRAVFFEFDDQLLLCDDFDSDFLTKGADFQQCFSPHDIEGQSAEMLADLAEGMERWLESPQFIEREDDHNLIGESLAERRNYSGFREDYLYLVDA